MPDTIEYKYEHEYYEPEDYCVLAYASGVGLLLGLYNTLYRTAFLVLWVFACLAELCLCIIGQLSLPIRTSHLSEQWNKGMKLDQKHFLLASPYSSLALLYELVISTTTGKEPEMDPIIEHFKVSCDETWNKKLCSYLKLIALSLIEIVSSLLLIILSPVLIVLNTAIAIGLAVVELTDHLEIVHGRL